MACGAYNGDALPMPIPGSRHGSGEQLFTSLAPAQILGALHYIAITRPDTQASLVVLRGDCTIGVPQQRGAASGAAQYWHLAGGHTLLT